MSGLPFSDLRVVSLEQAVAAPFCSRQLADMGADVIKVERPDIGDFARNYGNELHGMSPYFAWLNRGKRSITLDLKDESDVETFSKLIARADLFIHNLAPGAVEQLGFGYDILKNQYPRLIWCGISGYGVDGSYRDKKAYDMLIQAEAGIISLTGGDDSPAKVGVSMGDIASGLYAYSSIQTALIRREQTNMGSRIDISMLNSLVEWAMAPIYVWHGSGRLSARVGVRHNMIVPHGAYACADNDVIFAEQNDREWKRFCEIVLGQPTISSDERYATNSARLANRYTLEPLIESILRNHTRAEVITRLEHAAIANARLNDVADVMAHPQLRQHWVDVITPACPIPALIPPHNIAGIAPQMRPVPALSTYRRNSHRTCR